VAVTGRGPGYDEIMLTVADGQLCNSRACAQAGHAAAVVASFGVLADPGASRHSRSALWPDLWGRPVPFCGACWEDTRQVAARYRPGLTVRDTASARLAIPRQAGDRT
jgi:hypothetical protein